MSIEEGQESSAGDVVARIPREGPRPRTLPVVCHGLRNSFEARRPKDHAIIAEIDGYVRFGKDYKNKRRIAIDPAGREHGSRSSTWCPRASTFRLQEGDFIQEGRLHHGRQPSAA